MTKMLFLGNLAILAFVLFVFAIQIDKYNKLVSDKYRFRYFALRDKLAMLVLDKRLEEDSWEYQKIVDTINFHINAIETLSINDMISILLEYHTSPEEQRKIKIIKKKIEHPEVIEIMAEFMEVTGSLIERNSRMQIALLKRLTKHAINKHAVDMKPITCHKTALDKVYSYRDELRSTLDAKVAAA